MRPVPYTKGRNLRPNIGSGAEVGHRSGLRSHADEAAVTPQPYPGCVDHCAEALCLLSERCFRFINAEDGTGHPQHCPSPTEWRGRLKHNAQKLHTVETCQGHWADLDAVHRIG